MDSTRDGRIQTLNLLQHWFAWQLILRLPPRRHVRSTAAHGRCGVISRHITTRVFTLCWQVVYLAVFLACLMHDIHENTDD